MSWQQLLEIVDESRRDTRVELERRNCPLDATVLVRDADGVWRCGFCGWPKHSKVTGEH